MKTRSFYPGFWETDGKITSRVQKQQVQAMEKRDAVLRYGLTVIKPHLRGIGILCL